MFSLINASQMTSIGRLTLIIFVAQRLILIFPLITVAYWFWGKSKNLSCQRVFVCKTTLAIMIGLAISGFIGAIFPQKRPFMLEIGQTLLTHAPSPSFPSNHATVAFTVSYGFFFWLRKYVALLLLFPALAITWARVFLGIHWPLDMVGAFVVAMIACGISQIIWYISGDKVLPFMIKGYKILFYLFIKRGWFKG
ncbi:MAG: phosphatase PAP2 family protein [Candidatus Arsenophonus melophagi]|nr:phosphatase PAP2 family protein [Candidatus Arsenophonus melophagi]